MKAADLSVGIVASLCIHLLIAVYGIGSLIAGTDPGIMPEFRHGLSSIEINLTALEEPVPPEPEEPVAVQEDFEPVVPEEPEKEEEERPQEALLDEGVEQGDPLIQADVKPTYPLGARMRGEEGVVKVRVWIDAAGRAGSAELLESSGYSSLDRAGMRAAKKARFRDSSGNLARSQKTTVTFRFTLVD